MERAFTALYRGRLVGLQSIQEYQKFASDISGPWYCVDFHSGCVELLDGPKMGEIMVARLKEVEAMNMLSAKYPYTYIHTPDNPKMVKLYNPASCGGGCATTSPAPWIVFSKVEPTDDELEALLPEQKRGGFFEKIFRG